MTHAYPKMFDNHPLSKLHLQTLVRFAASSAYQHYNWIGDPSREKLLTNLSPPTLIAPLGYGCIYETTVLRLFNDWNWTQPLTNSLNIDEIVSVCSLFTYTDFQVAFVLIERAVANSRRFPPPMWSTMLLTSLMLAQKSLSDKPFSMKYLDSLSKNRMIYSSVIAASEECFLKAVGYNLNVSDAELEATHVVMRRLCVPPVHFCSSCCMNATKRVVFKPSDYGQNSDSVQVHRRVSTVILEEGIDNPGSEPLLGMASGNMDIVTPESQVMKMYYTSHLSPPESGFVIKTLDSFPEQRVWNFGSSFTSAPSSWLVSTVPSSLLVSNEDSLFASSSTFATTISSSLFASTNMSSTSSSTFATTMSSSLMSTFQTPFYA